MDVVAQTLADGLRVARLESGVEEVLEALSLSAYVFHENYRLGRNKGLFEGDLLEKPGK